MVRMIFAGHGVDTEVVNIDLIYLNIYRKRAKSLFEQIDKEYALGLFWLKSTKMAKCDFFRKAGLWHFLTLTSCAISKNLFWHLWHFVLEIWTKTLIQANFFQNQVQTNGTEFFTIFTITLLFIFSRTST